MPSTLEEAKARLERAFRVKFEREVLSDREMAIINTATSKLQEGDIPVWQDSPEGPVLTIQSDSEHPEDLKWILAREAVCRLGYSQREAADKFNLSYDNLRQRCAREEWPVPSRVKEAVSQASQNRAITRLEGETWAERGERSRKLGWAITERPLQALLDDPEKAPKVASWQDVATIVKLNRQAAGLDTSETSIQVGFAFGMLGDNVAEGVSGEILDVSAEEVPEKGGLPE